MDYEKDDETYRNSSCVSEGDYPGNFPVAVVAVAIGILVVVALVGSGLVMIKKGIFGRCSMLPVSSVNQKVQVEWNMFCCVSL